MKREIGGYLELEEASGKEYYEDLYRVNLGRTAFLWLLEGREIKKVFLPYFLCESVFEVCRKQGTDIEFYYLNDRLEPVIPDRKMEDGEYLYLVNYYGQLTEEKIILYKKKYGNIILDHTQAFFQRPLKGIDTIYSCRKFLGVGDGAYLSTDADLDMDKPVDYSMEHMEHVLGRYEYDAGTYYQKMLDVASGFGDMQIKKMSRLTRNLLRMIDYDKIKRKREENYLFLAEMLHSESPFNTVIPSGPFAYPFYHENGLELRKWLALKKIFVPINWKNVLRDLTPDKLEYQWSENILPLPCDQRYGREEMEYIAASIREWEKGE